MFMTLKRFGLATALILAASVIPAFAQGPTQTKIQFTIDGQFELKDSGMVLPAGHYVLFRIEPNDRNLFALYRDDMTSPPIAMIRTVPVYYDTGRTPGKTRIFLETDEYSSAAAPVLAGWNVPGDDGWAIIGAVTGRRALSALSAMSHAAR